MFRHITGVQEAIVHRQSNESLKHRKTFIEDNQVDQIAKDYLQVKQQWIDEREELIEHLKHQTHLEQIEYFEKLIECFNELIEHGEVNKNCQKLINERASHLQSRTERYIFTKKPLGDKIIRLPKHISKPTINLANPFRKITSEILHIRRSNEDVHHQVPEDIIHRLISSLLEFQEKEPDAETEKLTNGLQFYVVAEQFRPQKSTKKQYFTSSIFE